MSGTTRPTSAIVTGRILLLPLLFWALGALIVSASFLRSPGGTVGISADYNGTIRGVDPGSPAARASVEPGDRIDLRKTPFDALPKLVGTTTPIEPGRAVSFGLYARGGERELTLTAITRRLSIADRLSILLSVLGTGIFVLVGAGLILLRPSLTTWGFGLFCLLSNPVIPALARYPSAGAHLVYVTIYDILQNLGVAGLLLFTFTFLRALPPPRKLLPLLSLVFVIMAAWTLWIDLAVCVFASPAGDVNIALQIAFGCIDLVAVTAILGTYVRGPLEDRPRLRWVLIGFGIGLLGNYIGNVLLYTSYTAAPGWLDNALIAIDVTLPIAVAYAVVRHRVIEIDFFLSKAIVYAIMTSALVAVFAFSDWIFTRLLSAFRLSLVIDSLVSIGAALIFDRAQRFIERAVDPIVFRGRHVARDRLRRTARTFPVTHDVRVLDENLVREPHEAMGIAGMALFRKEGAQFRRVNVLGWNGSACEVLSSDDRLILEHQTIEGILDLADIPWNPGTLPRDLARPTLSIPLRSRNRLVGLLLCSLKRRGQQLDVEERGWLQEFVDAASVAYDELDAERLRKNAQELEGQVALLNARLDEARRLR